MAVDSTSRPLDQALRDVFHQLFHDRDIAGVAERYWTDESVDHFLALGLSVRGAADLSRFFAELFAALPDWRVEIEQVTTAGDRAVVQWRATGTHSGAPWQGIEATGRRIDLRGCDVFHVDEQQRVLTNTVYYDSASFARQVGMLPPRDSAADRALLRAFNVRVRLARRLERR